MNRRAPWVDCQAAIVDLDGTMVDTLADFDVALNGALAQHGMPPVPRAVVAQCVGKGAEHLVRSVLHRLAVDDAHAPTVLQTYQAMYRDINGQHATVFGGVREGLARGRQRGWRMACVTNKPLAFAQALLAQVQLAGFFDHVYGGDSFTLRKPDPWPLLQACLALRTTPAQTLVIGDSINDAQAARAAGCPVVLMRYGYNHGDDVQSLVDAGIADAAFDRLDHIPGLDGPGP
jgi:phosphoglycolate phosphatase